MNRRGTGRSTSLDCVVAKDNFSDDIRIWVCSSSAEKLRKPFVIITKSFLKDVATFIFDYTNGANTIVYGRGGAPRTQAFYTSMSDIDALDGDRKELVTFKYGSHVTFQGTSMSELTEMCGMKLVVSKSDQGSG
ncbi:unnamed protein product [Peronospora belbahrii]|uniref:Uncharacterized protein n=1 Tax=Peronospora belbahrii TaxID=622444 RepID=A0ABN8CRM0_9STRA|nr:unnamed protein product [Peronospora belbahrii]